MKPACPTPIYIDNQAAFLVSKATGTTKRLRHVDVQSFAIQDWTQAKKWLQVKKMPGESNPSDVLTKGTNSIAVFARHTLRLYRYYGPMLHDPTWTVSQG